MVIKFSIRNLLLIAAIVALAYVAYQSKQVILAALAGVLVAYMVNPVVEWLCSFRIPRLISTLIVVSVFGILSFVIFLWLTPAVFNDIQRTSQNMPIYINRFVLSLEKLGSIIKIDLSAISIYNHILQWVKDSGMIIVNWLGGIAWSVSYAFEITVNLVMIPLIAFMILIDYPKMVNFIDTYAGKETQVRRYLNVFSDVMASYFRGQIIVAIILAVLYTIILEIVGLDAAILLGIMTGLLSIVPFLGFTVGIVVSVLAAGIQFQDFIHPVYVIAGYGVVQMLESFVITPNIVGNSVGLHPVVTIIILLVGGSSFGLIGMVLALPVTSFLFQIYKAKYSRLFNPEMTTLENCDGVCQILLEEEESSGLEKIMNAEEEKIDKK